MWAWSELGLIRSSYSVLSSILLLHLLKQLLRSIATFLHYPKIFLRLEAVSWSPLYPLTLWLLHSCMAVLNFT